MLFQKALSVDEDLRKRTPDMSGIMVLITIAGDYTDSGMSLDQKI